MRSFEVSLSRRALLAATFALTSLPKAFAGQPLRLPMRALYARVDQEGFARVHQDEMLQWSRFAARLGGLVARIEPMPPPPRLLPAPAAADTGAACVLVARKTAADMGLDYVLLYSTAAEPRSASPLHVLHPSNWAGARALGEAHLLGLDTGSPLISVASEGSSPARNPLNRGKSREVALDRLLHGLEDRLRTLRSELYPYPTTIAD